MLQTQVMRGSFGLITVVREGLISQNGYKYLSQLRALIGKVAWEAYSVGRVAAKWSGI